MWYILKSRFVGMESGSGSAASELITIIGKYTEALKTILSGPRGDAVTGSCLEMGKVSDRLYL